MSETNHPAAQRLREAFPEADISEHAFRGDSWVELPRARVLDALRLLRDELGYAFLNDVTATDHPDEEERFRVVWVLTNLDTADVFRLKTRAPEDDPEVPSVTPLWATANWLERECFDMFGVRFAGHPDLRRILMPEDYDAFPLRKGFPMEGDRSDREWAKWVIARARAETREAR